MKKLPKGWARSWDARLRGASCEGRHDLPWIVDGPPSRRRFEEMRELCFGCPVRLACAEYALDPQNPALGGMYAGIWVTWRGSHDIGQTGGYTASMRRLRARLAELQAESTYGSLMEHFTEFEKQEASHA